jgi:hypothetical protein
LIHYIAHNSVKVAPIGLKLFFFDSSHVSTQSCCYLKSASVKIGNEREVGLDHRYGFFSHFLSSRASRLISFVRQT